MLSHMRNKECDPNLDYWARTNTWYYSAYQGLILDYSNLRPGSTPVTQARSFDIYIYIDIYINI